MKNNLEIYKKLLGLLKRSGLTIPLAEIDQMLRAKKTSAELNLWKTCAINALEYLLELDCRVIAGTTAIHGNALCEYILNQYLLILVNMLQSNSKALLLATASLLGQVSARNPEYYNRVSEELYRHLRAQNSVLNEKLLLFFRVYVHLTSEHKYNNSKFLQLVLSSNVTITLKAKSLVLKITRSIVESGEIDHYVIEEALGYASGLLKSNCTPLLIFLLFDIVGALAELPKFKSNVRLADICLSLLEKLGAVKGELKPQYVTIVLKVLSSLTAKYNIMYVSKLAGYVTDFATTKQLITHLATSCNFVTVIKLMRSVVRIQNPHFAALFMIYMCSLRSLNADVERLGFKFIDNIGKPKETVNEFATLSYDRNDTLNTFSEGDGKQTGLSRNASIKALQPVNDNTQTQQFVYADNFFRFNKSNTHIMPLQLKQSYYKQYAMKPCGLQTYSSGSIDEKLLAGEHAESPHLSSLLFEYSFQNKKVAQSIHDEFLLSLYADLQRVEQLSLLQLYLSNANGPSAELHSRVSFSFMCVAGVKGLDFADIDTISIADRYLFTVLSESRLNGEHKGQEHSDKRIKERFEDKLITAADMTAVEELNDDEFVRLNGLYQDRRESNSSTGLLTLLKSKAGEGLKVVIESMERDFDDVLRKVVQDPQLEQYWHTQGSEQECSTTLTRSIIDEAHKKALFYCQKWSDLKSVCERGMQQDAGIIVANDEFEYYIKSQLYNFDAQPGVKSYFDSLAQRSGPDQIDKRYHKELLVHHVASSSLQHAKYFSYIMRDKLVANIVDMSAANKRQADMISFNAHVYTKCTSFFDMAERGPVTEERVGQLIKMHEGTTDMDNVVYDYNLGRAMLNNLHTLSEHRDISLEAACAAALDLALVSKLVRVNQVFLSKHNLRLLDDYYHIIKEDERLSCDFVRVVSKIAGKCSWTKDDAEFSLVCDRIVDSMGFLRHAERYWLDYECLRLQLKNKGNMAAQPMHHDSLTDAQDILERLTATHNNIDEPEVNRKVLKLSQLILQKFINLESSPHTPATPAAVEQAISIYLDAFRRTDSRRRRNYLTFIFRLIDVFQPIVVQLLPKFDLALQAEELLQWIPQLMTYISSPIAELALSSIRSIIREYPQIIAHHLYYYRHNEAVRGIIDGHAADLAEYFDFFDEMITGFYDPELVLEDELAALEAGINSVDARQIFIDAVDRLLSSKSLISKAFVQRIQQNLTEFIHSVIAGHSETILLAEMRVLKQEAMEIFKQRYNRRSFHLSAFSTKLQHFADNFKSLRYFNQTNVGIVDTLKKVVVINSLRRPKCLSFFCTDGKVRKLLLKTGEDLRADARIMSFIKMTNELVRLHKHYFETEPSNIKTFTVVPLSAKIGLIEWIESSTLKDIVEQKGSVIDSSAMSLRRAFLAGSDNTTAHIALHDLPHESIVEQYDKEVKIFGPDKLKRAFMGMHESAEAFYIFKRQFEADYAVQCTYNYILGIGDRHLDNILVTNATHQVFMIDFNCCFGTGVHLKVPELVPFRLTPNLLCLMLPFGSKGNFKATIAATLQIMVEHSWLYMDHLNVYVREPIDVFNEINAGKRESRAKHVIASAIKRFGGCNPKLMLLDEIRASSHYKRTLGKKLVDMVKGIRVDNDDEELNIIDLARVLVDMATDKKILGRTWMGWMPFV